MTSTPIKDAKFREPKGDQPMEINGMAHAVLTVSNFETAVPFYEKLLAFLGMKRVFKGEEFLYYVGGRTALGISKGDERYRQERFIQRRVGLHHLCFRARERSDVDSFYGFLQELGAKIVHPPEDGAWAPGYYSVLFEDPDGIRLEMNHVPGQGLLAEGVSMKPGEYR
jgi:catechol 2,3-dioxygenase-like lactoylglutathione lyase family enzyme